MGRIGIHHDVIIQFHHAIGLHGDVVMDAVNGHGWLRFAGATYNRVDGCHLIIEIRGAGIVILVTRRIAVGISN